MSAIKQGYKQTKVGIIPQDWEVVKLGKIGDLIGGGTPSTKNEEFWNGNIPWISSSDLNENNIYDISISRFINEQAIKNSATKLIPNKSILIVSRVGVGKIAINNKPLCTSQDFQSLILKKDNHIFLAYKIKNEIQKLIACNQGTSIKGFVKEDLSNLQIPLPPLKEQEKIAEILTTWDEAITKQTELLEAKELQKKALMQKLLSGEVRFSGFSDEWEEVRIDKLFDFKKGQELSKEKLEKNGIFECILYGELYTTYSEVISEIKSKTNIKEGIKSKIDDILIPASTTTSAIDLAIASTIQKDNVLIGGDINILRKKTNNINGEFISKYLTHIKKMEIAKYAQGITIIHLYSKDFKHLKIQLPSLPEQQKIAEVLSLADDEINLLKNELEELKLQKKALMQKLLTGQVRVKV
jgi:type I restriction enzyme S subunit